jgi:hypothetical protein
MVARGDGQGKRSLMINTAIGVPGDRNDIDANTFVLQPHTHWPEHSWNGAHPACHPEHPCRVILSVSEESRCPAREILSVSEG